VVLILVMAAGAEAGLFGGGTKQAGPGGQKTSTGESGGGHCLFLSLWRIRGAYGFGLNCKAWGVECRCDRVHAPLLMVRGLCSGCAGRHKAPARAQQR